MYIYIYVKHLFSIQQMKYRLCNRTHTLIDTLTCAHTHTHLHAHTRARARTHI